MLFPCGCSFICQFFDPRQGFGVFGGGFVLGKRGEMMKNSVGFSTKGSTDRLRKTWNYLVVRHSFFIEQMNAFDK